MGDSSVINPERVVNCNFPEYHLPVIVSLWNRDATLYALGVGACVKNGLDDKELKYVYHEYGQKFIKVLPTFAAVYSLGSNIAEMPGLSFDPHLLLHGQQPTHGCIRNISSVVGLHDKGKAVIIEIEVTSYEESSDEPICMNLLTLYLRGAGGFSKSPHRYSYSKYATNRSLAFKQPKSQPFAVFEECTQSSQALLYRLSGDKNPLHSDPSFAALAGESYYAGETHPDMVKSISGRFLLHVYPGETLLTEMWLEGLRVIYQVKAKERNKTVLSGAVELRPHLGSL